MNSNLLDIQNEIKELRKEVDTLKSYHTYDKNNDMAPIGTFNGEDLYRAVFELNSLTNFNPGFSHPMTRIINITCIVYKGGAWRNLPWLYTSSSGTIDPKWAGGFYYNQTDGVVFSCGTDYTKNVSKVIMTFEYTCNDHYWL